MEDMNALSPPACCRASALKGYLPYTTKIGQGW